MSRSFKNIVAKPTQEQSPRKFKRHFNKKIRQKTKRVIEDFIQGVVDETAMEQITHFNEEAKKGDLL